MKKLTAGIFAAILVAGLGNAALATEIATSAYVTSVVGELEDLKTIEKDNTVVAINELFGDVTNLKSDVSGLDADVSDLYDSMDDKQDVANIVVAAAAEANATADNKYPSMAAAKAIADAAAAAALSNAGLTAEEGIDGSKIKDGTISSDKLDEELTGLIDSKLDSEGAALTYQEKSTQNWSYGNEDGEWTTLTEEEVAAVQSGITSAKVSAYDAYDARINSKLGSTDAEGIYQKILTAGNGIDLGGDTVSVKAKTDGGIVVDSTGVSVSADAFIPQPDPKCSDAENGCVLTYKGNNYAWEIIAR